MAKSAVPAADPVTVSLAAVKLPRAVFRSEGSATLEDLPVPR
jgi:hypothetical protein